MYVPVMGPTKVTARDSGVETASGDRARRVGEPPGEHSGDCARVSEAGRHPGDAEVDGVYDEAEADQHE